MTLPAMKVKATGRSRMNFAVQHMMAAARFSRRCAEIEEAHQKQQLDNFFNEIIHCCTATVFFSVASLEANINELFFESDMHFSDHNPALLDEMRNLLKSRRMLEKYQAVLVLKNVEKFKVNDPQFLNVDILVNARNRLVHFQPEWDDGQRKLSEVGNKLKGKFDLSPFISSPSPIFPHRCMGHGFAKWSIAISLNFMETFHNKADIPHKFSQFIKDLDPG